MKPTQFIRPEPVVIKLGPLGFHRYALQFFSAAKSINVEDSFSPVPYYLYCHSLELILKAFLLTKDVPMETLKKTFGHNLTRIFNKAKQLGIDDFATTTELHEYEIRKANDYYNIPKKGFEYFRVTSAVTGYKNLPDINVLSELISTLITELERPCLDAA